MVPTWLAQPLARKFRLQQAPTIANVSVGVARRVSGDALAVVSVLAQHTTDACAGWIEIRACHRGSSIGSRCMFQKNGFNTPKLLKSHVATNPQTPHHKPTTRVGTEGGPGVKMEGSGHIGGDRRDTTTRMPRGRCLPPITPVPDPKRGGMMKRNSAMQISSRVKDQSRIVVFSKGGDAARKPMSEWKRGYAGFERKVKFT